VRRARSRRPRRRSAPAWCSCGKSAASTQPRVVRPRTRSSNDARAASRVLWAVRPIPSRATSQRHPLRFSSSQITAPIAIRSWKGCRPGRRSQAR
jgi:hypothetical protein